jgi:hypothetical protein
MQDVYIQGCEFAKADPSDPIFSSMVNMTHALEEKCRNNQDKWNYILVIFFKDPALMNDAALMDRLLTNGWTVERTDTNPHLKPSE